METINRFPRGWVWILNLHGPDTPLLLILIHSAACMLLGLWWTSPIWSINICRGLPLLIFLHICTINYSHEYPISHSFCKRGQLNIYTFKRLKEHIQAFCTLKRLYFFQENVTTSCKYWPWLKTSFNGGPISYEEYDVLYSSHGEQVLEKSFQYWSYKN